VQLHDLLPSTKYFYQITAANGTTESDVLSFTTSRPAGTPGEFSIAVVNDMGYTNAGGTFRQLEKATDEGLALVWHGGDLSYADDCLYIFPLKERKVANKSAGYDGILPCESDWDVCSNGSNTELPGPVPDSYKKPLPEGEIANQGGPNGGDMSVIYEVWINNV
jgi:hypothetical protein